ncbi:hypothetical protein CDAR_392151 [Caerostris darwini]|uniref:Uncharacterized protein n=1 Tax=Caerostris darwini TaxID=1538125 RepID=A0AAV4UGT3_9ARAC|nr:hypothetical protein CDAR_392151 [Caerostris darwini]
MWYKCIKTGAGGNAKRGMIAITPLFECDGSISPQGEPRDSRRSIGCGCGYSTSFFPSTPKKKMSVLIQKHFDVHVYQIRFPSLLYNPGTRNGMTLANESHRTPHPFLLYPEG